MNRSPGSVLVIVLAIASSASGQPEPPPVPGQGPRPTTIPALPTAVPQVQALVPAPPVAPESRPLPINLATALRLADARPLVIQFAQARVEEAAGVYEQAQVLWLPSLYFGADLQRHDGGAQLIDGGSIQSNRTQLVAGGGYAAIFAFTDAIFAPLAARQVVRAREADVQAARNDALLATAEAYFQVQQARGRYAGLLDTITKARLFLGRVEKLAQDLVPPVEVRRARATLADLEQAAAESYGQWQTASADLTRVLRLDPTVVVAPVEPPVLQVTLVPPPTPIDDLVPIGLLSRPELESQRALVQATLERLRQERLRPLIPSLAIQGNAAPPGRLAGGYFNSGVGASLNNPTSRHDVDVSLTWELQNLLLGNRGRIQERIGQQRQAEFELYRVQDLVAAEVVQAHAQVTANAQRMRFAEEGLKAALSSVAGNFEGLSETVIVGNVLQLVNRPQEVVSALQQLDQAYRNFVVSVAEYNRSQFRLFRALGYPARVLACEQPIGLPEPVNTERPGYLPAVVGPEPCPDCGP